MIVAREQQVEKITKLINSTESCFFITGISQTGKTLTTRSVFKEQVEAERTAWVDCVECLTMKILFERILRHWNAEISRSISIMEDFLCELKPLSSTIRRFLVFDHCEALMELDQTVFSVFLKLADLTEMNICVVFVTSLKWGDLLPRVPNYRPNEVEFPNYTEVQVIQVLMQEMPQDELPSFYGSYVTVIAQTFRSSCKNLGELRYICTLLFPKFCEPVQKGIMKREETSKLYLLFSEKYLKPNLNRLYLREISSSEWNLCSGQVDLSKSSAAAKQVELPYFTRFLLIASFLASYNPSKYDNRFFSKGGEGRAKPGKKGGVNNGSLMRSQLVGPKAFLIDRMLMIFYSIIPDQECKFTFDIHSQISTLISLRLLTKVSSPNRLDNIKCKCSVSFVFIKSVSKSVQFDIGKYLYDFVDKS